MKALTPHCREMQYTTKLSNPLRNKASSLVRLLTRTRSANSDALSSSN